LRIKANLIMPNSQELMKSVGLNKRGKAQCVIDSFVLYHSEPYVPGRHIHEQGINATDIGSGKVIWNSPDANYLYEGKLMVDPITLKGAFFSPNYGFWSRPKTQKTMDPQNRNLHYHGGGLRDKKWFDRMINEEMNDLIEEVQNIVNGGK